MRSLRICEQRNYYTDEAVTVNSERTANFDGWIVIFSRDETAFASTAKEKSYIFFFSSFSCSIIDDKTFKRSERKV